MSHDIMDRFVNVKYLKHLASLVTNDARCTREIKSKVATAKVTFRRRIFQPAIWT